MAVDLIKYAFRSQMRAFDGSIFTVDWIKVDQATCKSFPLAHPFANGQLDPQPYDTGAVGGIKQKFPARARGSVPAWVCDNCYVGMDTWWHDGWPSGTPPTPLRDGWASLCDGSIVPVFSVGLAAPPLEFTISGSPVTSIGTLVLDWKPQTQRKALMSPVGATGIPSFREITLADLPPISSGPTLYSLDRFEDTDNTLLQFHQPTYGPGWTAGSGAFQILFGSCVSTGTSPGGPGDVAVVDAGHADAVVQVAVKIVGAFNFSGIVARYSDVNHFWLIGFSRFNNTFAIYKYISGSFTLITSTTFTITDQFHTIKVVFSGNVLTATLDGLHPLTTTDAFNNTATKFGLRNENTAFADLFNGWDVADTNYPWPIGTMTSVILTGPLGITWTPNFDRYAALLTATWDVQAANKVFAGPITGAAAAPNFRVLAVADIPLLPSSIINPASGAFPLALIPPLPAAIIVSGVFPTSVIPFLDASWITSGVFAVGLIPALPYAAASEQDTISAAGTTQGTAYVLTAANNRVTTAAVGLNDGVKLWDGVGAVITICNDTTVPTTVKVYPPSGASITPGNPANAAVFLGPGTVWTFCRVSPTQWVINL